MRALVEDAVVNKFAGFALDMVCGGHDEPQRAEFLDDFAALVAVGGDVIFTPPCPFVINEFCMIE